MKRKTLILTFLLLFVFVFVAIINPIPTPHAQDDGQITYEKINPNNETRYKLKRLAEKIEGVFVNIFGEEKKVDYLAKLSQRRLSELSYVINNEKRSFLETSSDRYNSTVGLLIEELNYYKADKDNMVNAFKDHANILAGLRDKFPSGTAEWRFVQQSVDTSNSLISRLSS
jgi:hypothetical protein